MINDKGIPINERIISTPGCCEDSRSSFFAQFDDRHGGENELYKKMARIARLWNYTLWRAIPRRENLEERCKLFSDENLHYPVLVESY